MEGLPGRAGARYRSMAGYSTARAKITRRPEFGHLHSTSTAIERGVDARKPTELDAGVGARNVEESGTIQGANLHVFDCFGL